MPFRRAIADRYKNAVIKEMASSASSCSEMGEIDSIYFGGGTPSLVPAAHIADILDSCRRLLPVSKNCEISLEANPGTISAEKAETYRRSGVNRVSMGAQSFNDRELSSIGRLHTADMIRDSLSELQAAGFGNINLDLMLGLPGQTAESWRENLEQLERLKVQHASVYMLDLDEPCPLYEMTLRGNVRLPDEDLISDLYLETIDALSAIGFSQYEISNFSRPGHRCRHNLKYWQRDKVHGFGLASHSFDGICRYSNYPKLEDYFQAIDFGRTVVNWSEPVTVAQSLSESLFLGLRLTEGLDWNRLQDVYGEQCLAKYESDIRQLSARGLVERKDEMFRLTPPGMLVSNEIFQLFI
jgi:oxygen-independent coproporphyrinogen-3 oxidase